MYGIMSSEEMAKRIRSNVKRKKKLYKDVGKLFACMLEMKEIYDSQEGCSYDSEFWLSVIDHFNLDIDPDELHNETEELSYCLNRIYRARNKKNRSEKDYLKELKKLEKLGEEFSDPFDEYQTEGILEDIGLQNFTKILHRIDEYEALVKEKKKYYKRIAKYFAILLEMTREYRYASYCKNFDMAFDQRQFGIDHSLILNSKKDFADALFVLREILGTKHRDALEMIIQLGDMVRMINECYPEFLDSYMGESEGEEEKKEDEIICNAIEPLKVQTETPDVPEMVEKSECVAEDVSEVRIVDYFPEAYDLVDDSVDIRIPDHINYKDFVEYLHREEIQKSMSAAKFWDMVVSETEKINNEMKDRYHAINQNHDGYRPYIVHDFLKALIKFYPDAEQYTVFAYCRNKYSRTTILYKFGRNTDVYSKLLLPNYVNGKMTIDDIVYITTYKPQTIKMDLYRHYGQDFSYEELYPNVNHAKRANKD